MSYLKMTGKQIKHSDLVVSDDVNQGTIDVVDGYAKSQDDDIFSHSSAVRVSTSRYVIAIR